MLNLTQIITLGLVLSVGTYFIVQKFKNIIAVKPEWQAFFDQEFFGIHKLEIASVLIGGVVGVFSKLFCLAGLVTVLVDWGMTGLADFVNGSWGLYIVAGLYSGFQTTSIYSFFKTTTKTTSRTDPK